MKNESVVIEDMGNAIFRGMLRTFEKIIADESSLGEVEDQLKTLKGAAARNGSLTTRQIEAIAGRCDNYLNGTYGNTKKPEHYDHAKPSK